MKRVKLCKPTTIDGQMFKQPVRVDGEMVMKDGQPEVKDMDLIDILQLLVTNYPAQAMVTEDSIHGHRLYSQLVEARKECDAGSDVLFIEEAEHDWIKKALQDDRVGIKMFGMNLQNIRDAVDDFEKPHEVKEE